LLAPQDRNASPEVVAHGSRLAEEMREVIRPHFLRREKGSTTMIKVSETRQVESQGQEGQAPGASERSLPPKTDLIIWLSLHEFQKALYKASILLCCEPFGLHYDEHVRLHFCRGLSHAEPFCHCQGNRVEVSKKRPRTFSTSLTSLIAPNAVPLRCLCEATKAINDEHFFPAFRSEYCA
jgi:hypothetical protein